MTAIDDGMFWEYADPFLAAGAERSTMMGNICLRLNGAFFASLDHRTGDLIVKLPATRVTDLVNGGDAASFAPNGRVFKEWASISPRREDDWAGLMEEALAFASSS
ncbi:MAG: hypothetical protein KUG57_01465 [Ilumatobacteraceae bacterium]|nr:hypothetical protein [Ilumatobacteraceae bacterium]